MSAFEWVVVVLGFLWVKGLVMAAYVLGHYRGYRDLPLVPRRKQQVVASSATLALAQANENAPRRSDLEARERQQLESLRDATRKRIAAEFSLTGQDLDRATDEALQLAASMRARYS